VTGEQVIRHVVIVVLLFGMLANAQEEQGVQRFVDLDSTLDSRGKLAKMGLLTQVMSN
jgi:hypothetical protein